MHTSMTVVKMSYQIQTLHNYKIDNVISLNIKQQIESC